MKGSASYSKVDGDITWGGVGDGVMGDEGE